jgi:hypothetical protein
LFVKVSRKSPPTWVVVVILIAHATFAAFTLRDIARRPGALVRGKKVFWGAASTLNSLGGVAYWVIGRRPA